MNTDKYFYSIIKNEDAIPYVSDNLIIVADGLGGAGSTVHNIEQKGNIPLRDRIYKAAFFDFDLQKDSGMCKYLAQSVEPMADGNPDTSALWASRIAIARCAYALEYNADFKDADLCDEKVRKKLADYICAGLDGTAEYFQLEKGKFDDQKILPTTLAMVRFRWDAKIKTTFADALWAGDSRCYLLNENGLRQLSKDDEDASGAITNLFCADNKNPTELRIKRFKIEGPCVLMVVSDGIFDPFEPHDNFMVEKVLSDNIAQSRSYEELMKNLKEFYAAVRGDDATMAFAPIGFDNYKSLQKVMAKRTKLITETWQKYDAMKDVLEVVNQPEEDIRSYVENRTRDKFSTIIPALLDGAKTRNDDSAFTQEVIDKINDVEVQLVEKQKAEAEKRVAEAINELRRYLKMQLMENPENIFARQLGFGLSSETVKLIEKVKSNYVAIEKAKRNKLNIEEIKSNIARYREKIKNKIDYYLRKYDDCGYDAAKFKEKSRALSVLKIWLDIDLQFAQRYKLHDTIKWLDQADKALAGDINNFIIMNKSALSASVSEAEKSIDYNCDVYRNSIDNLFDEILKTPQVCEKIFEVWAVDKYKLTAKKLDDKKGVDAIDVSAALASQKEEIAATIVNALAKNYDKTSVIDFCYNATRLNSFRLYYKARSQSRGDIDELNKKLADLKLEYEELITENKDN